MSFGYIEVLGVSRKIGKQDLFCWLTLGIISFLLGVSIPAAPKQMLPLASSTNVIIVAACCTGGSFCVLVRQARGRCTIYGL